MPFVAVLHEDTVLLDIRVERERALRWRDDAKLQLERQVLRTAGCGRRTPRSRRNRATATASTRASSGARTSRAAPLWSEPALEGAEKNTGHEVD